jgi:transcriptional regulator with XRE-family HTH domain
VKLTPLKLRRLERALLQIEVAQRAGIARSRLSELENGHVRPRLGELERLGRTLGIAADALSDSEPPPSGAARNTTTAAATKPVSRT